MCPIHYSAEASLSEGGSGCKETSNSRLYMLVDRCPIIYNPAQMQRCTLWLPAVIQGHLRNLVLILGLPGLWSVNVSLRHDLNIITTSFTTYLHYFCICV